jgi:hypothetical protein
MLWINKCKHSWRIAFLVLLAIALSGPWVFDLTWVPLPYTCSTPHIRLNENFCGRPQPITWIFTWFIAANLDAGVIEPVSLLFSLFLFLLVLPFYGTLVLIRRGGRQRWRIFHTLILGLAAGVSLYFLYLSHLSLVPFPRSHLALWGIWLYVSLIAAMFLLEVMVFRTSRRPIHE